MSKPTSQSRPIIFTQEMIAAILGGAKTQTRRLVNPQPAANALYHHADIVNQYIFTDGTVAQCPFGEPGDLLYVRETHWMYGRWEYDYSTPTKTGPAKRTFVRLHPDVVPIVPLSIAPKRPDDRKIFGGTWYKRPAIFMPKAASRLILRVEAVRAERLRAITEADAQREGVKPFIAQHGIVSFYDTTTRPHVTAFCELWDEINGERAAWSTNPMVYVVDFSIASRT